VTLPFTKAATKARRKELIIVDRLAKRYGVLPSTVVTLGLAEFEFCYKCAEAGADQDGIDFG